MATVFESIITINGERKAILFHEDRGTYLRKMTSCSLGDYFLILTWLISHGYDVK